eukprot:2223493-Amphidinium_carterae.1
MSCGQSSQAQYGHSRAPPLHPPRDGAGVGTGQLPAKEALSTSFKHCLEQFVDCRTYRVLQASRHIAHSNYGRGSIKCRFGAQPFVSKYGRDTQLCLRIRQ